MSVITAICWLSSSRLLKCREAQISPTIVKPEMRKTLAGITFPPSSEHHGIYSECWAIVAQILWIVGKFDPCRCFHISDFRNVGEIWPLSMYSHRRLPTSHDSLPTYTHYGLSSHRYVLETAYMRFGVERLGPAGSFREYQGLRPCFRHADIDIRSHKTSTLHVGSS